MVEHESPNAASSEPAEDSTGPHAATNRSVFSVRTVVWGILSLAFVAYLVFGSVDARIWRTVTTIAGSRWELKVESKSIATIWKIQAQNLPHVSHQWMMESLFYGSIAVFVACVIVGMRFLLVQAADEVAPVVDDQS